MRFVPALKLSLTLFFLAWVSTAQAAIPASERAVLLALYESTNGAGWTNRTGWGGAAGTECSWYGVSCTAGPSNRIEVIDLSSNNLAGGLPGLSDLTALRIFRAHHNQLAGPVPSLGGLTALQVFDARFNQFTGLIPSLGGLTALQIFGLSSNQLSGPIPSLDGLSALQGFYVDHNQLTGSMPSLNGLTGLQQFHVENNQLTGSIPTLSGLTALQYFAVDENQLTGAIPSLSGLTALQYLQVSGNQLTGPIPLLSGLTSLQNFEIDGNQLTGSIPSFSELTALQVFYGCCNQLTGSIPALSGLTALREFDVSYNQLSGSIPSLSGLTALHSFAAISNQLTGSIPSLSGVTALQELWVPNNLLTGPVPAAPTSLIAGQSNLCGNSLESSGNPAIDAAWVTAQYTGLGDVLPSGFTIPAGVAGGNWLACQTGPVPPTCTLTATPPSIALGGTSTLTVGCGPLATSYVWTGGTCAGTNGAICTVAPTATTTYTVAGVNSAGTGNTVSATVTVTPDSQADCLFNWAETTYPSLFAPAGTISTTLTPYYYRYYPQTNAYLAASSADSHVYYLGPVSNNSILDVGALSAWLPTAGCQ